MQRDVGPWLLLLDYGEKAIRRAPPLVITEEQCRTGLNLIRASPAVAG